MIDAGMDQAVRGLTELPGEAAADFAHHVTSPSAAVISYRGSDLLDCFDRMNADFIEKGWSDGLPLVPPVREKVPFIQDAFVRDVNTRSVADAAHPKSVDIKGVEARMLANVIKVMRPGKVKMVTICTVQIAELHPTQTPSPRHADALHDVAAYGTPLKSRCEASKDATTEAAKSH